MVSLNRVLLIGNLTKDPELRYTPSGTPVANLRLAVNSMFKDQAGQRKEETCFVTIVVWSRQAEICNQYLKKGRSVFIEGRLIYRSWEAEGKTRSTMEVRADRVQFLGPPAGGQAGGPQGGGPRAESETHPVPAADAEVEAAAEGGSDADVPF
ncbi:MAG: single-stranded DNA-binding protein [Candidatus Omnitrophica bacterium]|nr:single-stranded DNA-binding protein [Candidatus Omnitrophota bacterium]